METGEERGEYQYRFQFNSMQYIGITVNLPLI